MGNTSEVDFLAEVAKLHKEWVRTVRAIGGGDFSEDIVQEMYLKLHKYANAEKVLTNGRVNKGYVFFALKSILYTLRNEQNKIKKVPLDGLVFFNESNTEEQEAFNKVCKIIDNYLYDLQSKAENEEKESYWYDGKIFEMYRDTDLSMRGIAKEIGVSWISIFNTLKNVRADLKNRFQDDWDDYINEDYELL
jgi:DNA-directed RNA polymerase specialized sigma24 family protein